MSPLLSGLTTPSGPWWPTSPDKERTKALVRIVPIAPFTLVNMVAGASHISVRSSLIVTAVGIRHETLAIMIFEEGLERVLRKPD